MTVTRYHKATIIAYPIWPNAPTNRYQRKGSYLGLRATNTAVVPIMCLRHDTRGTSAWSPKLSCLQQERKKTVKSSIIIKVKIEVKEIDTDYSMYYFVRVSLSITLFMSNTASVSLITDSYYFLLSMYESKASL